MSAHDGNCFIRAGNGDRPGWAVELCNLPGDAWFDLTRRDADAPPEE